MLRSALCDILRLEPALEIVAEAGRGEDAVALALTHLPDLVLLDVEMPGQSAAETVRQLRAQVPSAKVLILSMYDDQPLIRELMALGVCAYLHKSATRETLVSALRLVATSDQQVVISVPRQNGSSSRQPEPAPRGPRAPQQFSSPSAFASPSFGQPSLTPVAAATSPVLSARELEVLQHVATAMSNRQIAVRLGITENTVKRHLRNIFGKLDAVSRIDAVNKAQQVGLGPSRLTPAGRPGPPLF